MDKNAQTAEKKLIAIPFAYETGMKSGVNIQQDGAKDIYLKNLCVATASAKYYNPDCTVALFTNIKTEDIPLEHVEILRSHKVEIIEKPFDRFRFPYDYRWALAFYKLCALSYMVESGYDKLCCLDADVYVQGSLDEAWEECGKNILLYDINRKKGESYRQLCEEISQFLKLREPVDYTHYGGEFFIANTADAKRLVNYADMYYRRMVSEHFRTSKGDEFILCIAAEQMKDKIRETRKYIYRFWTGPNFRLVPDSYRENPVAILHLPDEKNNGLVKLYNKYIKKGVIPENKTVWKLCRLNGVPLTDKLKKIIS